MTLAIAQKRQPMALCSKEKARFGTWRFILPPSPIYPILRCLLTKRKEVRLRGIEKVARRQLPMERDMKGTSCTPPATTY
jgi:hypothetical protein